MDFKLAYPLTASLLGLCIFSTTYPQHRPYLYWFRLILSGPAFVCAYAATYPSNIPRGAWKLGTYQQLFFYGSYLLMRLIDVCLIGYGEGERDAPKWITHKKQGEKVNWVALPLPTTLRGRIAYTIDNLVSIRGSSLYADHSWDWAPKGVREYRVSSRWSYVRARLRTAAFSFILLDTTEFFLWKHQWNLQIPNPVTSLPLLQQIPYTLAIGVFTYTGIDLGFAYSGLIFVPILRLPPSSCPPFYNGNPFKANSLAEFWSLRWHTKYRRMLDRLSLPILRLLGVGDRKPQNMHTRLEKIVRCLVIFLLTTAIHVATAHAIPSSSQITLRPFVEPSTFRFFMSQPFGILFELVVIQPMSNKLPGPWATSTRRVYLWVWMIWMGRWYSDGYVLYGQFKGRALGFSPIAILAGACQRLIDHYHV
ncbi:hypothetical protein FRB96_004245 [Tulasnella sp. 330]|nr:hypothetical protein FRB96_004245 [Tulasnella sp. 330]KAG8880672.1 hypothetical protein FRB98_004948 [Tulasnella sp. 332]